MTLLSQKVIETVARAFYEQNDPGGWKDLDLESKLGYRCAAEGALNAFLVLPDSVRDEVPTFPATFEGLLAFLDERYPAGVFTGESGDVGARLVVLARRLAELGLVRDAAKEVVEFCDAVAFVNEPLNRRIDRLRAALNEESE